METVSSCWLNFLLNVYQTIAIYLKELSLCHKFCFSATQCRRPWIFQTNNSLRSNSLSLKYQVAKISGLKKYNLWQRLNSFVVICNYTVYKMYNSH